MVNMKQLVEDLILSTCRSDMAGNPCLNWPHCLQCGDVMVPVKGGVYGCQRCLADQAEADDYERRRRDSDAETESDPCQ